MELFDAIKNGEADQVIEIINNEPALVNAIEENGVSAILTALYYKKDEIVKILLEQNPDLNIFEASAVGAFDKVKVLVEENRKIVNHSAPDGFFPLGLACFFGQKKIAGLLIKNEAKVNQQAKNSFKVAPLHSSVSSQNIEITNMLLSNGADPNLAQTEGVRPIHQAAHVGNIEMVKLLLKHGADPTITSDDGKNAIEFAKEGGFKEVITIINNL